MATPRKRYFKVADQLIREDWPRDVKLTLVLLMAELNTRWARDGVADAEAGNAKLGRPALLAITGKSHFKSALKSLQKLSEFVSISLEKLDDSILIRWPKFANFQYVEPRSRGKAGVKDAPSATPRPATLRAAAPNKIRNTDAELFPLERRTVEPTRPRLRSVDEVLPSDAPPDDDKAAAMAHLAEFREKLRGRAPARQASSSAPAESSTPPRMYSSDDAEEFRRACQRAAAEERERQLELELRTDPATGSGVEPADLATLEHEGELPPLSDGDALERDRETLRRVFADGRI